MVWKPELQGMMLNRPLKLGICWARGNLASFRLRAHFLQIPDFSGFFAFWLYTIRTPNEIKRPDCCRRGRKDKRLLTSRRVELDHGIPGTEQQFDEWRLAHVRALWKSKWSLMAAVVLGRVHDLGWLEGQVKPLASPILKIKGREMIAKSFKQMRVDGTLTRADSEKIQYKDLYIEPGFNAPGRTEQDDADDESLYAYIAGGGRIPELDVRPREGGGVWIVDGHRRHKQIGRAIEAGTFLADPKSGRFLIPVKQFTGNDVDRVARIATSNEGKKLTPMQLASVYQRLVGFGLTPNDIAIKVNRKRAHVDQILVLANANHDVQQMIVAGEVAPTTAAKVVKKKGDAAGPALREAQESARLQGKSKVTAKQIEGNTPLDLVRAIQKEMESGGTFKAEDLAPAYAPLINYLRGTLK